MKNIFFLTIITSMLFLQCTQKTVPNNSNNTLPAAIQKKMDALKSQLVQNPPAVIYQYDYNGQKVYYFNAPCCDQFSTLLNDKGELICHPDGGFTGKGDCKCNDFTTKRTNEVLIWKDERGGK